MMKTYTTLVLLVLAACGGTNTVTYQEVCTEAHVPALNECVDKSKADPGHAEDYCRTRICVTQEPWLRHYEYGGVGTSDENYSVPCAKATREEDRELCETAGYVYGHAHAVDPNALASADDD